MTSAERLQRVIEANHLALSEQQTLALEIALDVHADAEREAEREACARAAECNVSSRLQHVGDKIAAAIRARSNSVQ